MSLLNDISRSVNVIDARRHALKKLFLVFSDFNRFLLVLYIYIQWMRYIYKDMRSKPFIPPYLPEDLRDPQV